MKTNTIKLMILSLIFVCYSCSDVLDKDPLVDISGSTFWKTESDVQAALTAAYAVGLRSDIYSARQSVAGVYMDIESLSDNALCSSGFESYATILRGGITPSTGGAINDLWSNSYKGIAACNYFLDNISRAESFLPAETLNKYKAEALFLRSYYYNELIQLYGAVPLTLKSEYVGSGYENTPRSSKEDVVSQILADLEIAIPLLPNTAYTNGHAVRGSAIMLKVRILMNNHRYTEAADAAWTVIGDTANPFRLANDYAGIFFGKQENNPEIMFSVIFKAPADYHSLDQMVGSRMSCFPTKELRNAYEPGDPRLKMTIFQIGDSWINNIYGIFQEDGRKSESVIPITNMAWKKWINPEAYVPTGTYMSDQHIVKMRYADLLLMYAEAMFESGKGTDTRALKALNDVRARSGVEMPAKTELTRENIRNERRIELAYEGLRYNDLLRWDIAKNVIPMIAYDKEATMFRKYDGLLWPIPQSQMDIMSDIWVQNDAYK
ncbi:RagB/SusD family nutrient uptake outer membrane protein [Dysgonomonas reticulitermitis]